MSYMELKEYEIIPTETYKIIRNCSGCGGKSIYQCTDKIRMNANGKKIDVWLIYQCGKCKHTYNLPVYSRINRDAFDKAEYEALQRSDQKIVMQYGLDRELFQKNGSKIHTEPSYVLKYIATESEDNSIRFRNPYRIRIRHDKLIAECLGVSRSEARGMLDTGRLSVNTLSNDQMVFRYSE